MRDVTQDSYFLVLPPPPSSNKRLAGTRRRARNGKQYNGTRQTEASKDYQKFLREKCRDRQIIPIVGPVRMVVHWWPSRKADVPDRWKDLCDGLESKQTCKRTKKRYDSGVGCYLDDIQIADWHVVRHETDTKNPRIEITVQPMQEKLL